MDQEKINQLLTTARLIRSLTIDILDALEDLDVDLEDAEEGRM